MLPVLIPSKIRLKPDTDALGYEPIVLRAADEGEVRVVGHSAQP